MMLFQTILSFVSFVEMATAIKCHSCTDRIGYDNTCIDGLREIVEDTTVKARCRLYTVGDTIVGQSLVNVDHCNDVAFAQNTIVINGKFRKPKGGGIVKVSCCETDFCNQLQRRAKASASEKEVDAAEGTQQQNGETDKTEDEETLEGRSSQSNSELKTASLLSPGGNSGGERVSMSILAFAIMAMVLY